jgi:predicted TIM-barrel fold metal-dependent hydrolase
MGFASLNPSYVLIRDVAAMPLLRTPNTSQPDAFECSSGHTHSGTCCGRRDFLTGLAALGAGAVLGSRKSAAQPAKPFRIDVHHHFSSPGFIAEITGRRTGQVPLMRLTAQKSLEDMDKGGVATAIVSISEPSVFFGNYDSARTLARETNEFGARMVTEYPGRFGLFGTIPLPDVEGALREIEYVLDTLHADGICMMTDYEGKFLGDPAFTPVMEELNRRKTVVYTHPFRNACCRNLVPDVFEPTIELGTDTTRTIASLIFSGTAARLPDIKWIFSHGGGTAPYLVQRFTFLANMRKDLQARFPEGPIHYLQQFYYDTANASTIHPLASLMKLVPSSQVVFGTDFPFLTAAATAAELRETGLFSPADLAAIDRGNAATLLPKYRT